MSKESHLPVRCTQTGRPGRDKGAKKAKKEGRKGIT